MDDLSRLSTWLPFVAKVLPVGKYPATEIVSAPVETELICFLDGPEHVTPDQQVRFYDLCASIATAMVDMGCPIFLRSDLMSGKHGMFSENPPCFVDTQEDIPGSVIGIVEQHVMVNLYADGLDRWAVRERLKIHSNVTAFRGLPIVPERRVMVNVAEDRAENFPYWPAAALESTLRIEDRVPTEQEFSGIMEEVRHIGIRDNFTLQEKSLDVARALAEDGKGGEWSVDWMLTSDRGWVLIDMAEASRSWIPEE